MGEKGFEPLRIAPVDNFVLETTTLTTRSFTLLKNYDFCFNSYKYL